MKQSPFLQCSSGESSYPSLDLKDTIIPCSPLIGSMLLILTCYGLIETASPILICHLAGSSSIWRQTALSPTATHPPKVLFRTSSHATQLSPWGVQLQWDVCLFFHSPLV